MKSTLWKFLGLGQASNGRPRDAKGMSTPPASTQQHTDVQRELVRVVLKDTLRRHGIPSGWVDCEVTVLPRRADTGANSGGSSGGNSGANNGAGNGAANHAAVVRATLLIHLIIMKWNDALAHFAPALQQQLLQALDRFEPLVNHSNDVVAWRFSPQCGCPYKSLPDPLFWTQDAVPVAQAAAPDQPAAVVAPLMVMPKPKFDLPPSSLDNIPSGFAPTEPGPLR